MFDVLISHRCSRLFTSFDDYKQIIGSLLVSLSTWDQDGHSAASNDLRQARDDAERRHDDLGERPSFGQQVFEHAWGCQRGAYTEVFDAILRENKYFTSACISAAQRILTTGSLTNTEIQK